MKTTKKTTKRKVWIEIEREKTGYYLTKLYFAEPKFVSAGKFSYTLSGLELCELEQGELELCELERQKENRPNLPN